MRAVLQRVSRAEVQVDGRVVGQIGAGLLVLLGIRRGDSPADADFLARKITQLRIFDDEAGRMNCSLLEKHGDLLVVSQFTLYGDTRKGNRPSYSEAEKPEIANGLYDYFVQQCRVMGLTVETGIFQANMSVHLVNDGPVTLLCSSKNDSFQ